MKGKKNRCEGGACLDGAFAACDALSEATAIGARAVGLQVARHDLDRQRAARDVPAAHRSTHSQACYTYVTSQQCKRRPLYSQWKWALHEATTLS